MEVEEELEPGTRLGEVTAIDEDIGENAAINYAIICEYNNVLSPFLHSIQYYIYLFPFKDGN